jgi:monoamine oxidase
LRPMLIDFVEGYHAAHVDRISARSLQAGDEETEEEGQTRQFRILQGNDSVVQWLRSGLDPERVEVRLNTIATAVRWKKREVTVECRTGSGVAVGPFSARALIVTIPLGVWKANAESPGAVRFEPELTGTRRAVERLESGNVFKIVLRFRRAFWEDEDFVKQRLHKQRQEPEPLTFLHSHEADVPTWWSSIPVRAPILTGWAGGPRAESLLSEDESTQVDRSVAALSKILSVPRRRIDDLVESWNTHDWRADPFSRGAYSYVAVGGVPAQKALGKPVDATIFIAGEATNVEETGTVSGAIASGRRAARELLHVMRP